MTMNLVGMTPKLATVTITLADTTYSYTIPDRAKKLYVKLRDISNDLKISYDNFTTFMTIPGGSAGKLLDDVYLLGRTIYFQSPTASQTVEIEVVE